jgi:hypothetical protein
MAVRQDASAEDDPQMMQMKTGSYLRSISVICG